MNQFDPINTKRYPVSWEDEFSVTWTLMVDSAPFEDTVTTYGYITPAPDDLTVQAGKMITPAWFDPAEYKEALVLLLAQIRIASVWAGTPKTSPIFHDYTQDILRMLRETDNE